MVEEKLNNSLQDTFSVLAVIVLYKEEPSRSAAVRTILESTRELRVPSPGVSILLFDNTPEAPSPGTLPQSVLYEAPGQNMGLAAAYNRALTIAQQQKCTWLLTLDQDTSLPCDFLENLSAIAVEFQTDPSVGAIVPQLMDDGRLLSPSYVHTLRNTAVPEAFVGFNQGELFALNSAALLRVAAIRDLGGFSEDFWLDQLDHWLHHQLYLAGKRVFIAGNIRVEHKLSLLDFENLSPVRFRNFLEAESAFFDLYRGPVANLALTARLLIRYYKHWWRRSSSGLRREIAECLKARIFSRKGERIAQWQMALGGRMAPPNVESCGTQSGEPMRISVCMAAYNGAQFIVTQIRSILDQLGQSDELIVVDDLSTDQTVDLVKSLGDSRIRLVRHSRNLGVVRSFEDGLMRASGSIIFLADQDDIWLPGKVSAVLGQFCLHPGLAMVVSDASLIDQNGVQVADSFYALRGKFSDHVFANILRSKYHGCTMAFRAELLSNAIPFPRSKLIMHDQWLGMINKLTGGRTEFISRPLVSYRRHDRNVTGRGRLSLARHAILRLDLLWALIGFWLGRGGHRPCSSYSERDQRAKKG